MRKYVYEYLLFFAFIITQFILLTNSLWYDELCTTPLIIGYEIGGIINELRFDAHPPLYFILLKIFTLIFGKSIIVMKSFNIVISSILAIVIYSFSKKNINREYAIIATSIFCFFPTIYNEIFQIRMYVVAPLFVTLTAIYGYYVYKSSNKTNIILLLLFTICSIYTHYYALIGVVIIHLILYFSLIKKNNKEFKTIILLAFVSLISFIPWITTFLNQLTIKNQNIGDNSSAIERIIKTVMYPFYTGNYAIRNNILNYIISAILILAFFIIIIFYFRKSKDKLRDSGFRLIMNIAFFVPIFISSIFVLFSIFITPIWYSRYFIVFYPIFIFGFSYMLYNMNSKIRYTFIFIVLISSVQKIYSTYQITSDNGMNKYAGLIDNTIKKNDIILDANNYTSTYFPSIKQYNLRETEAKNWDRHIYWNVNLLENYDELLKAKDYFWSMNLVKDSICYAGNNKFKIDKVYNYNYLYYNVGVISMYKYSKIQNEK